MIETKEGENIFDFISIKYAWENALYGDTRQNKHMMQSTFTVSRLGEKWRKGTEEEVHNDTTEDTTKIWNFLLSVSWNDKIS